MLVFTVIAITSNVLALPIPQKLAELASTVPLHLPNPNQPSPDGLSGVEYTGPAKAGGLPPFSPDGLRGVDYLEFHQPEGIANPVIAVDPVLPVAKTMAYALPPISVETATVQK
ncbi:hypothetical protein ABW20_dc0108438 [Dactylellina cionopaga]|nr:hypothetical protein ABW20_dc0108438 [Dactylellina cionopaga]